MTSTTEGLPLQRRTAGGRWHLAGSAWDGVIGPVTELLRGGGLDHTNVQAFKRDERRMVLRYSGCGHSLVIKVRRSPRWFGQFRHRRELWEETQATLTAAAAGLPVPAVIGYGIVKDCMGAGAAVMLQQYRPLFSMRDQLLSRPSDAARSPHEDEQLLDRAAGCLDRLFHAGCHHVDFGPHAILLADQAEAADELIDFEFAQFWQQPSIRLAVAMGGYFAWSAGTNRNWFTHDQLRRWFGQVLERLELKASAGDWALWRRCFEARQPLQWRTQLR